MISLLAQVDYVSLASQFGFGGATLAIVAWWLRRIDSTLEGLNHTMRGLSKAIYLDLAERATPGSFVREEAKRMVEKDRQRSEWGQDKIRRD